MLKIFPKKLLFAKLFVKWGKNKKPHFREVLFSDPAGTRTQGPYIKSVLLYQLSYEIGASEKRPQIYSCFLFTQPLLRISEWKMEKVRKTAVLQHRMTLEWARFIQIQPIRGQLTVERCP